MSLLTYLSVSQVRKLRGQQIKIADLLGYQFKDEIKNAIQENFTFQYRFRMRSIAVIFQKEIVTTIMICILFIWVNYTYLTQFNMTQYKKETFNIKVLKSLDTGNPFEPYWLFNNRVVKHKVSNDLTWASYN